MNVVSNVLAIIFDSAISAEQKVDLAMRINLVDAPSGSNFANSEIAVSSFTKSFVGKYCIIRTYSAGVHCGIVEDIAGTEVILKNARRIHYWDGAFTLSAIALSGAGNGTRMSVAVPEILLTEAIEVLPCSPNATDWLSKREVHSND